MGRVKNVIADGVREIWLSSEDTGAYGKVLSICFILPSEEIDRGRERGGGRGHSYILFLETCCHNICVVVRLIETSGLKHAITFVWQ